MITVLGRRMRTTWARLRRWLVRALLAFVAVSVMLVLLFRWLDPPGSAVILQRLVGEGAPQHYAWVDIAHIHPAMALAAVAAEDQRFLTHSGFDTAAIMAAVGDRLDGGRLRGASTITQQVARNLFLWQGRSLLRKSLEAWFTALIEVFWSKRRILEVYLNIAQTGEHLFGVGAASRRYFGHAPAHLDQAQAALIAAVLPNPVSYRVDRPSAYVRQRQQWILTQMRNLGGDAHLQSILQPAHPD